MNEDYIKLYAQRLVYEACGGCGKVYWYDPVVGVESRCESCRKGEGA